MRDRTMIAAMLLQGLLIGGNPTDAEDIKDCVSLADALLRGLGESYAASAEALSKAQDIGHLTGYQEGYIRGTQDERVKNNKQGDAFISSFREKVRNEALEEAAKLVESRITRYDFANGFLSNIAADIRALKTKSEVG